MIEYIKILQSLQEQVHDLLVRVAALEKPESVQEGVLVIHGQRFVPEVDYQKLALQLHDTQLAHRYARQQTATHKCKVCGARWRQFTDKSWSLCSDKAGPCCDNVAMGDQIEPIGKQAEIEKLQAKLAEASELLRLTTNGLRQVKDGHVLSTAQSWRAQAIHFIESSDRFLAETKE
jgi:hypothetical protein